MQTRYPELIELELRVLARTLLSSNPDHALELLKEKIESYAHGGLPHAKHVVSRLYEFMESDDNPVEEPPLPAVAPPHQQEVNGDWAGLKNALTNSLTSGVFLDTQLYAVESRTSTSLTKIHPIYFCSDVGGVSFVSKLMACKPFH